jgi:hypothetical protein
MKKITITLILFLSLFSTQIKAQDIEIECACEDNGVLRFIANNRSQRPYFVVMIFNDLTGSLSITQDYINRVDPGTKQLCTVKPNQGNSPFSSYSYRYFTSDPSAKIDPEYPYLIPVKDGSTTQTIAITNISTILSRGTPDNWYCIGFKMNAGDTIFAARGGIVSDIKESEQIKGQNYWFNSDDNFIAILQDDGTLARYTNFENDKVFPKIGDKIIGSQPIGIVSAGHSNVGPHIKLTVYHEKTDSKSTECALMKFCVSSIKPEILLPNNKYVARHYPEVVTIGMSRKMKKKYLGE